MNIVIVCSILAHLVMGWCHVHATNYYYSPIAATVHLYLQAQEVSKSIPTDKFNWFEDNQVFVLWDWEWVKDNEEDVTSEISDGAITTEQHYTDIGNESDDAEEADSEATDDGIPEITHCVVFKCIGCIKEHHYQEVLINTNQKCRKGESFLIKLEREPDNPNDCNAIAFIR